MAQEFAAHLDVRRLPTSEGLGSGGELGLEPESVQQAVWGKRQHIRLVPLHGLLEGSIQQTHCLRRKKLGLQRNLA